MALGVVGNCLGEEQRILKNVVVLFELDVFIEYNAEFDALVAVFCKVFQKKSVCLFFKAVLGIRIRIQIRIRKDLNVIKDPNPNPNPNKSFGYGSGSERIRIQIYIVHHV